jgi:hypothetical protein
MKVGDLVFHKRGTIYPHKKIVGVIREIKDQNYKVFWYTTGNYQNMNKENLQLVEEKNAG